MERGNKKVTADQIMEAIMNSSESGLDFEDSGSSFCPDSESEDSVAFEEENYLEEEHVGNITNEDDGWIDIEPESNNIEFTGEEKISIDLPPSAKPIDYFNQLFTDQLVQKIVTWTNARAKFTFENKRLPAKSNLHRWKEVTVEEIKKVIALCILMPLNKKPELKQYWSKNPLYFQNIFGATMSRITFENIIRCMCFYDHEQYDKSNRLHKIENVVNHIIENINKIYSPPENLSLDEALLLWRGRLVFRQYIPNKRHKYGIKFYELCTPDGFLINMLIYTGKGTVTNEKGHSYGVVVELMKEYLQKGHTLYMDNYYCSIDLAEYLLDNKTNMCGTLRANRKRNPTYVIKSKLTQGAISWRRNRKNVTVLKWKDKRDVLMVSTKHNADMGIITSKRGKEIIKPKMIVDYNINMPGIDRSDQMMSYYACPRRSIRWYMKVFFHMLDVALWNSCWIYNKINAEKPMSFLLFREQIVKAYLGKSSVSQKSDRAEASSSNAAHFPDITNSRKRCRQCHKNKKRTATKYICGVCRDKDGENTRNSTTDGSPYRNHIIFHLSNKREVKKLSTEKSIYNTLINNEDQANCSLINWFNYLEELSDSELSEICHISREPLSKLTVSLLSKVGYFFTKYQRKYNKVYTEPEKAKRLRVFKRNLIKIYMLNRMEQGTAKYGITEFTDMTESEYKQRAGLLFHETENEIKNYSSDIPNFELPKEHDWRKKGVVSKVKNQGNCGSCWAFSVTGNIEGLHAIKTGKLEEYSEQELLDCDTVDSACSGGLLNNAYKAIEQLGGLELENEYPYKAKQDTCHFNNSLVHVKVNGAIDLPSNETAIALWLVANGPISIGINANAMQFYRGGISHPWKPLCRPKGIDHGVLIVGFGVQEYPLFNKTIPFWIVKNSWGDRWGEQGYYRIFKGDNSCGISAMASSAVL